VVRASNADALSWRRLIASSRDSDMGDRTCAFGVQTVRPDGSEFGAETNRERPTGQGVVIMR